jgi:hypothetical protein
VISNGTDWSAVGNFTAADAAKAKKWDTVAIVTLNIATLPSHVGENESLTSVECQITLKGPMVITAKGLLFGGSLGLMLSLNGTKNGKMAVPVLTMAEFNNERYGPKFAGIKVATPPKRFPVTDRCDCGDYDWYVDLCSSSVFPRHASVLSKHAAASFARMLRACCQSNVHANNVCIDTHC